MAAETTIALSELDQIMPRFYVRWLLCIPQTKDTPPKKDIVKYLESGRDSILNDFPILGGYLSPTLTGKGRLEVKIRRTKLMLDLKVKHLDDNNDETIQTYESLRSKSFPVSKLPDKILTPPDLPFLPVFDMMVTFIRGGILLCVKCHHAVMDGCGMGLIVRSLAHRSFQSSQHGPAHNFEPANLRLSVDRSLLPTESDGDRMANVGFTVDISSDKDGRHAREYRPMVSHIFNFPSQIVKRLKSLCISDTALITTNDALTALLYGAVSYARSYRLTGNSLEARIIPSTMGIAVNGRKRLKQQIPLYTGNVTLYATFCSPLCLPRTVIPSEVLQDLSRLSAELTLPVLAAKAHAAVAAVTHHYISSTISLAASLDDLSYMQPSFSDFHQGTDFFMTSGVDFPVFEQEWWPGGAVDALRIPLKGEWDGSCAVMAAKDRNGSLQVLLGLREDDMTIVGEILSAFGAYVQ